MQPQNRIILDHERMQGAKRAMLAMVTNSDQYLLDGRWYTVSEGWQHGQPVESVRHYQKHSTTPGDVIIARRIDGVVIAHIQVTEIHMANTADLTESDMADLGYADRLEFETEWAKAFSGRVWLIHFDRVSPQMNGTGHD